MPTSLRIHRHVLRSRGTDRSRAASPEAIAGGLAEALRAAAPADRCGVWLIRCLDVHFAIASGTGARAIAGALAAAVVRELERTLDAGRSGADVRWYPDRAAFLGQWLVDVRAGRAHAHWEYRGFAADSAQAAIVARAEAEPDELLAALRRLPAADLDEIVALLAPADAAVIAHDFARGPGSVPISELAATAARLSAAGRLPHDPRRATLLLLIAQGGSPGAQDAAHARDVALVLLDVQACPWHQRDALIAALRDGDWAAATGLGASTAVQALANLPDATRIDAVPKATHLTPHEMPEPAYTRFGGQFLLLPLLAELPLEQATAGWPMLDGTQPHVVLGALGIVGVLGADAVLGDPCFGLATGLPPRALVDMAAWAGQVAPDRLATLAAALDDVLQRRRDGVAVDLADPELLISGLPHDVAGAVRLVSSALLRELAYRLPGMATASVTHLRRNVLAMDADVTVEDERIVVQLGHPPLNLLLSLTGMNRRSFTLDATGNWPWVITTQR